MKGLGFLFAVLAAFSGHAQTASPNPSCTDEVFNHPARPGQHQALDAVGDQLRETKVLRAAFKQEKKIKVLRRPLRSSGSFLICSQNGLYWASETPFETVFIVTPRALYQKSENSDPITIQAEERPVVYGFTRVFLSLFSGDTQQLEREFDLFFSGTAEHWTIGLIPKNKIMRKLVDRILICGSDAIEFVDFRETSGDQTRIHFSNIATTPTELTQEELARFDF